MTRAEGGGRLAGRGELEPELGVEGGDAGLAVAPGGRPGQVGGAAGAEEESAATQARPRSRHSAFQKMTTAGMGTDLRNAREGEGEGRRSNGLAGARLRVPDPAATRRACTIGAARKFFHTPAIFLLTQWRRVLGY